MASENENYTLKNDNVCNSDHHHVIVLLMEVIFISKISTMNIQAIYGFSKTEYLETYKFDLNSILTRPTILALTIFCFLPSTFARITSV